MNPAAPGLQARTKLACLVAFTVGATLVTQPPALALLLGVGLLPWLWLRPTGRQVRAFVGVALLAVAGSALSQGLFLPGPPRTVVVELPFGLSLAREGLCWGAGQSLRLIAVAAAGLALVVSTPTNELVAGLAAWGLPPAFAFQLALALRFGPVMAGQARRLHAALSMRAASRGRLRRLAWTLGPLTARLSRRATTVGRAAEARAWDPARRLPPPPPLGAGDRWTLAAAALFVVGCGLWARSEAAAPLPTGLVRAVYGVSTAALVPAWWLLARGWRGRSVFGPAASPAERVTLALGVALLFVALLPFRGGLARVPMLDALIYAIPYSAALLAMLCLVPRPGTLTTLILGQALLAQLLGGNLNPLTWPYHLWIAWSAEAAFLATGANPRALLTALSVALARGAVSNAYSYALLAPLLWRKVYAPWYIAAKVSLGLVGCALGAWLAWSWARRWVGSGQAAPPTAGG